MKLKEKYVELLMEDYCNVIKTEYDALEVLNIIQDTIIDEAIESFINNDLCLFNNKMSAFDWFYGEGIELYQLEEANITITNDMVGKDMKEAIIDALLNSKPNYYKVNNDIYLTHWE